LILIYPSYLHLIIFSQLSLQLIIFGSQSLGSRSLFSHTVLARARVAFTWGKVSGPAARCLCPGRVCWCAWSSPSLFVCKWSLLRQLEWSIVGFVQNISIQRPLIALMVITFIFLRAVPVAEVEALACLWDFDFIHYPSLAGWVKLPLEDCTPLFDGVFALLCEFIKRSLIVKRSTLMPGLLYFQQALPLAGPTFVLSILLKCTNFGVLIQLMHFSQLRFIQEAWIY